MRTGVSARVWLAFGLGVLLFTSGCGTYAGVGREYRHRKSGLRVALPHGWLRYVPVRDACVLTQAGLPLEQITIRVSKTGRRYPGTQRVLAAGALPHEIAEFLLGVRGAREDTRNFQVERIALVTIGGRQGFGAEGSYTDPNGLPKRMRLYGVLTRKYLCEFEYGAAEDVYFRRHLPLFEKLMATVRASGD